MISMVQEWLTAVIAVTLLIAVTQRLIPEGAIRKVAAFISGLILLMALLKPLLNLEIVDLSAVIDGYNVQLEAQKEAFDSITQEEWSAKVEEMTAACIEEYAAEHGISAAVTVHTELDKNNIPVPASVKIDGGYSEVVAAWIESEIGVPEQQQHWKTQIAS